MTSQHFGSNFSPFRGKLKKQKEQKWARVDSNKKQLLTYIHIFFEIFPIDSIGLV